MAKFSFNIPDKYLPGLVAEFSTFPEGSYDSMEAYLEASAIELLKQRCITYKVGPYYEGPTAPEFNADGTPFKPEA